MIITIDMVEPVNLKNGLVLASHDAAVKSIKQWAEENLCPLTKARWTKAGITKANVKESPDDRRSFPMQLHQWAKSTHSAKSA